MRMGLEIQKCLHNTLKVPCCQGKPNEGGGAGGFEGNKNELVGYSVGSIINFISRHGEVQLWKKNVRFRKNKVGQT